MNVWRDPVRFQFTWPDDVHAQCLISSTHWRFWLLMVIDRPLAIWCQYSRIRH